MGDSAPPALNPLHALSPLDGRYADKTAALRAYFSEFALLRARVEIEVEWFIYLAECADIKEISAPGEAEKQALRAVVDEFSIPHAARIKEIETATQHDVKAVEYFVKETVRARTSLRAAAEFVHFACTSEDINNLAYGLLLRRCRAELLLPRMQNLIADLNELARAHADQPMLARTHGQPASPTTVGKEFRAVAHRLTRARAALARQSILGKFNGASGNFNAHLAAYPDLPWPDLARDFVSRLGLEYLPLSTQIEPHDYLAEFGNCMRGFNAVLIDFARDVWGYVALGYFRQRAGVSEIGSSAMPHKINPIHFENAEGNLGVANALFEHFAAKLPLSRWQRDLTDSTVLRNLGVAFGHSLLAIDAARAGLARLAVDAQTINRDLARHWEVLAEAIQTVLRKYAIENSYEKLKTLTRGQCVEREALHAFIAATNLPDRVKQQLLAMTPAGYIGCAAQLARLECDARAD